MDSMNCALKWQEVWSVVLSAACICCVSLPVTSRRRVSVHPVHHRTTLLLGGYVLIAIPISLVRGIPCVNTVSMHVHARLVSALSFTVYDHM